MAINLWQLGRHLTSVVVTPQTVGTAGALTAVSTAAVTLTAKMDSLSETLRPTLENISSINAPLANNVIVEDDFEFTISYLKVNNSSDPNPMRPLIQSYDIFAVSWTEGTGGSARTITGTCSRGEMTENFQGKGKQTASMTFHQVDNGTSTWTVT